MDFIIKWKSGLRGSRSEIDKALRKEGWGGTMTEEQADKSKYLEKKMKDATGQASTCPPAALINRVK